MILNFEYILNMTFRALEIGNYDYHELYNINRFPNLLTKMVF